MGKAERQRKGEKEREGERNKTYIHTCSLGHFEKVGID